MSLTRKRVGVVIGLLVLAAVAIWQLLPSAPAQAFVTERVQRGSLTQTVDVTGNVKSTDDIALAFGTTGALFVQNVHTGDVVKAGDILAELNTAELRADVAQAHEGVAQAQAELDKKNAGISNEEERAQRAGVAVAEARVAAAHVDYTQAVIAEIAGNSADAATVAQSQSAYDQVDAHNAEVTVQANEDLLSALNAALISLRSGLQNADEVLGVENTLLNDEYEDYVGVLDQTTVSDARDAFLIAAEARDTAEDVVIALSSESTSTDVLSAYTLVADAFTKVSTTLLYTDRVLDNSVSQSGTFTNADLLALQSSVAAGRNAVAADYATLLAARQSYDTAMREADNRYDDATNALALAKANQDAGEASRNAAVLQAQASLFVQEASLAEAQAKLDQVLAKPRSIDLAGLAAAVAQAQAQENAALARLRKAQIVAPIDGMVADVAFDVGEQVSAGATMMTLIANAMMYEIVLDIPESDIAKIGVDQRATITLDAFGDRVEFGGTVYSISPAQKEIEGVVYYEAKVLLRADQDLSLVKPGMSADVVIHTQERESVLSVPSRAILENNGGLYVRVVTGEATFEERAVTVGIRADGGRTEIVNGITEGDEIVVTVTSK